MTAIATTVGILSLLYLLVIQWSYQRGMLTKVQYRARLWGSICLSLTMGLIIFQADLVPKPAEFGSPVTVAARFGAYMLVMCLLLMGMVVCAMIDIRETMKAYIQAQRNLLKGNSSNDRPKQVD